MTTLDSPLPRAIRERLAAARGERLDRAEEAALRDTLRRLAELTQAADPAVALRAVVLALRLHAG